MARRYVPAPRPVYESRFDAAAGVHYSLPQGGVTDRDRKAYARVMLGGKPAGAALDRHPWAQSWSAFLCAIRDKSDAAGARAECKKAADASRFRLRNAAGMAERIPSEGGFLVPERLRQDVLAYLQTGIIRPRCQLLPLTSLRTPVPVLDNPSQANGAQALGGLTFAMTEEGAGITPSAAAFGAVELEARKAAAYLVAIPNELLDDATVFSEVFLPQIIARGYDWFVDDMVLASGTGVGEPQSLVNAPAAVLVSRSDPSGFHVSHLDVITMLKNLHPASKCCATWLCSEDLFGEMLEIYEIVGTAPTGQDIEPPKALKFNSGTGRWELLGLEIIANDHQPAAGTTGDLMLCDLGLFLWGERDELVIEIAGESTGFPSYASNIRIKQRVDGRYWPQQSTTLTNGKVVSPLVILE